MKRFGMAGSKKKGRRALAGLTGQMPDLAGLPGLGGSGVGGPGFGGQPGRG
jgi:hypothetical protein